MNLTNTVVKPTPADDPYADIPNADDPADAPADDPADDPADNVNGNGTNANGANGTNTNGDPTSAKTTTNASPIRPTAWNARGLIFTYEDCFGTRT